MTSLRPALAALAVAATCAVASAADLPPQPYYKGPVMSPAYDWTGFYLGLNAGGGIGNADSAFSITGGPTFGTADNRLTGGLIGVQAGYNWQRGPLVFGVETDFQIANIEGSLNATCAAAVCGVPLSATYEQSIPWFGTVRGRLGYAADTWLLYATGGFAYARVDTDPRATVGALTAATSWGEVHTGWTLGAGVEIALSPRWTARVEYLHLGLGNHTRSWALAPLGVTDNSRVDLDIVRLGANYRF